MRLMIMALLICTAGCATVQIPNYIKADNPYTRRVYGDFDKVAAAVRTVLAREKIRIEKEVDPGVYERDARLDKENSKGLLIITDVKQSSRILYSQYFHLNIYLHALADSTEVEVRFAKVNSFLFSKIKGTRNDRYAQQLLDRIEAQAVQ